VPYSVYISLPSTLNSCYDHVNLGQSKSIKECYIIQKFLHRGTDHGALSLDCLAIS